MNTTAVQPSYRNRLGYHSMVLGGICTIVATFIILGNQATHEKIQHKLESDQIETLNQVLPHGLYNNNLLESTRTITIGDTDTEIYIAKHNDIPVAFAFPITGYGYSGAIQLILGIDSNEKILGVRVISHAETPGLGDKIEINKDDWITSFDGYSLATKPAHQWAVKKDGGDFDQFTGATITPRAIVGAVFEGLKFFHDNKAQLMADPTIEHATGNAIQGENND